jgi:hypothetical protein
MKEITSIFVKVIPENNVPGSVSLGHLDKLEILFPDLMQIGRNGKELVLLNAQDGDDRIKNILNELVRFDLDVWSRDSAKTGIGISKQRLYEEVELDRADYFHYCNAGGVYLGEVDYPLSCDSKGVPALAGKPRQKTRLFGSPEPVHPSFFVVRGDAKEKLENAGFKGLRLYPVVFNRARSLAPEDQLWAVWSDLVLPPMKNLFRNDKGEMGFAENMPDTSIGISPVGGFLSPAELHYRREDLERFGVFDVAMIREPLKVHGTLSPRPIFSQRFRRFVIEELGVPFKGIPVRIDDDDLIPWEGPYPTNWAHLNRRPEWLEKLQEEVSKRGAN